MNKPIAVLGGGNQGHTIAADLTLSGYKVNFYEHPQFEDAFKTTLEKGIVEIEDLKTGRHERARIHKVTTDMKEAISDVRLILEAIPSYGEELFFNTMIPNLKDGQVVILMAGNFGSLRLRTLLGEKVKKANITIYETSTMPYGTRLVGPAAVSVIGVRTFGPTWVASKAPKVPSKVPVVISALPAKDTNVALEEFQKLYPFYSPVKNVLVSAMNNLNFIGHAAAMVLNAGRIEYANLYLKCEFRLHREGHPPSVQRVEDVIFDEMAAIVKALGGQTVIARTSMKDMFERVQTQYTSLGPLTLRDRYITEDVPYGLVPMSQLGEKLGVATPLMSALIEIASVLNQEDYRKTGRTLESLGLAGLSQEQIVDLVEKGI